MITFFCPQCWKQISKDSRKCPFCSSDVTEYEKKSFVEKLLNALNHPERETVQRAVWILGHLKIHSAVTPLLKLFNQTDNPYLKRERLIALNEIAIPEAITFIKDTLKSEISIVRNKAEEIILKQGFSS